MRLLALAFPLSGCANVVAEPAAPRLVALERTREVTGMHTNGVEHMRFEPVADDATLTLAFVAPRPECDDVARWRFPEGHPTWPLTTPERQRLRSRVASMPSPASSSNIGSRPRRMRCTPS